MDLLRFRSTPSARLVEKLLASFIVLNAVRGGSTHISLGTHAAQIARHATCNVHLVRG